MSEAEISTNQREKQRRRCRRRKQEKRSEEEQEQELEKGETSSSLWSDPQEYWRPIQWAILCSMPLRELQSALVSFWSHSLHLGLFETLLAIPVAILRATTGSLVDSHVAVLRFLRNRPPVNPNEKVGFSKLMQWLVSFGFFVLVYECIGIVSIPLFAIPSLFAYVTGSATPSTPGVASTLSAISSVRHSREQIVPKLSLWTKFSRYLTSLMLNRLRIAVGIGLVTFMIVGSVTGFVLLSYKMVIEGKEAVISLKTHLEENNYAERTGLKHWVDENRVPELIDSYTSKFYEAVLQRNVGRGEESFDQTTAHYVYFHGSRTSAAMVFIR
ncbi:PREDICTED: uncharacterized protein LOC104591490 [Nelumbo nucifera]|uniref:Uncharacterized protein LOC104591490 n=1 Tax=Nelumbo nucifera TaxID=4432 RepID=A0A1U7Z5S9_NELNU|nr:PREDICTED: uncharacterized protein LOC104591490 [Nelumbo nucifera]